MSVDRAHVTAIATLARLRFDGKDLDRITEELNQVLAHVEQLKSLEVTDEPGEGSPLEGEGDATRGPAADAPDELSGGLESFAPDARDGFFAVPPLPGVHAEEER
jgi:aspartyl/glutamyl-tRNA(Asn/Gln) amidotransferase C subunit